MKTRNSVSIAVCVLVVAAWYAAPAYGVAPAVAVGFQDWDNPSGSTLQVDVLAGVSSLDGVWSLEDVVPTGSVVFDYYATGTDQRYLDAISFEFDPNGYDQTNLTFRAYMKKGNLVEHGLDWHQWEHYQFLPGTFNTTNEDFGSISHLPIAAANGVIDHFPGGVLDANSVVGWVEFHFDATSDPLYSLPNGNIGVTLRLWNWRVDTVELVSGSVEVDIDIRPGCDVNPINLGSPGLVPVAILTTEDFDATTVDPATVKLAGASVAPRGKHGQLHVVEKDVDHDGDVDLLLKFMTDGLELLPTSTSAELTGETFDGTPIVGSDTVRIVPRPKGEGPQTISPIVAVGFQDWDNPSGSTPQIDVLSGVSSLDGVWSLEDVVPTGSVVFDYYATGTDQRYLDAISFEFDPNGYDQTNLTFRAYMKKGNHIEHGLDWHQWEHYQFLPGTFNTTNEDFGSISHLPIAAANGVIDHFPGGVLDANSVVGWVEFHFDATSDPLYSLPNGNIGVTLRLWNWRVDAVELVGCPVSTTAKATAVPGESTDDTAAAGDSKHAKLNVTISLDSNTATATVTNDAYGNTEYTYVWTASSDTKTVYAYGGPKATFDIDEPGEYVVTVTVFGNVGGKATAVYYYLVVE